MSNIQHHFVYCGMWIFSHQSCKTSSCFHFYYKQPQHTTNIPAQSVIYLLPLYIGGKVLATYSNLHYSHLNYSDLHYSDVIYAHLLTNKLSSPKQLAHFLIF